MEQMNLFDYMDEIQGYHLCSGCAKAKYKERTRRGMDVWYCSEMRAFITPSTTDWICRNGRGRSLYERRVN